MEHGNGVATDAGRVLWVVAVRRERGRALVVGAETAARADPDDALRVFVDRVDHIGRRAPLARLDV